MTTRNFTAEFKKLWTDPNPGPHHEAKLQAMMTQGNTWQITRFIIRTKRPETQETT